MSVAAYRSRPDGRYPVSLAEIRAASGMLFGGEPTADVLTAASVDPVEATAPPAYDPATQMLGEGAPAQSGGVWRQTWVVLARPVDPTAGFVPTWLFRQRAEAIGIWPDLAGYLFQNPAQAAKVFTLQQGLDPSDAELLAGLDELKVPKEVRDILLAPPGG